MSTSAATGEHIEREREREAKRDRERDWVREREIEIERERERKNLKIGSKIVSLLNLTWNIRKVLIDVQEKVRFNKAK